MTANQAWMIDSSMDRGVDHDPDGYEVSKIYRVYLRRFLIYETIV